MYCFRKGRPWCVVLELLTWTKQFITAFWATVHPYGIPKKVIFSRKIRNLHLSTFWYGIQFSHQVQNDHDKLLDQTRNRKTCCRQYGLPFETGNCGYQLLHLLKIYYIRYKTTRLLKCLILNLKQSKIPKGLRNSMNEGLAHQKLYKSIKNSVSCDVIPCDNDFCVLC